MLSRSPGPRRTRDWTRSRWRRSRARVRHARELSLVEGRDANGPAAAQRLRCQHGRAGPRARPKDPADHGEDAPLLQPRSLQDAEPSPGRRAPRDPQALPEARGCGSADPAARVDRCCPLLDITRSLRQHIDSSSGSPRPASSSRCAHSTPTSGVGSARSCCTTGSADGRSFATSSPSVSRARQHGKASIRDAGRCGR